MPSPASFEPLRVTNFRHFFLAEVINSFGSAMSGIALAFAVLEISPSPTALGIVVACGTLPGVALMMLGGALADRLPRGAVLRGCNALMAVLRVIMAVLVITGTAKIWHLAVLAFLSGIVWAVSYPAFHGMVPVLLEPAQRKAGFLLISQSNGVLRILGPALAGVLVATVGPGWAMAIDALTFAVAAAFLALLKVPAQARPERQESLLKDFSYGWAFARRLGWVVPVASASLVFNSLIAGTIGVLGPTLAADTIGSRGWGFANSAEAIGLLVMTVVLTRVNIRRGLVWCVSGFSVSAVPVAVLATDFTTLTLGAAFLIAGAGFAAIELSWALTVQEKVPEEMLSRIMSIDGFFSFVAMPIGQLAAGPAAHAFGIQEVIVASAALILLTAGLTVARPVIRGVVLAGS